MIYDFKQSKTKESDPEQTTQGLGTPVPGIIVEKYILEITRYPNGSRFIKSYEIGAYQKAQKSKKQKVKSVKSISSVKENEEI